MSSLDLLWVVYSSSCLPKEPQHMHVASVATLRSLRQLFNKMDVASVAIASIDRCVSSWIGTSLARGWDNGACGIDLT
jgi:hypothetical protein